MPYPKKTEETDTPVLKEEKKLETILESAVKMLICVSGIYTGFILASVKLEEILDKSYSNGAKSRSVTFSVAIQFAICTAVSALVLVYQGLFWVTVRDMLMKGWGSVSGFYVFTGMFFTNMSFKFDVNFLLFNMVKNSKCLAAMLVRFFIPLDGDDSSLSRSNIMHGVIITVGLFIFNLSGLKSSEGGFSIIGSLLIFTGSICDAFAGRNDSFTINTLRPHSFQLMFFTSFWIMTYATITGFVIGEIPEMTRLCLESPDMFLDILVMCCFMVFGQMFIYITINWFGSIYMVLMTTTRKVFTILLSIFIHGHVIDFGRGLGMSVLFFGLGLFTLDKYQSKMRSMEKRKVKSE